MDFEKTYNTIFSVCNKISKKNINAFLIGGISASIQTQTDLYRQNDDLDLMVDSKDLDKLLKILEKIGYSVEDKRGIKTNNFVDKSGKFHPMDHELNADTERNDLLGIGIFVYTKENGQVTLNSYSKNEKEGCVIGSRKVIPEELFNLMYNSEKIEYKGTKLMSASKEYTYMIKSKGKREKDLQDAKLLEDYIRDEELEKIKRIKQLEHRTQHYLDKYDETGTIISSQKVPGLEDTIKKFIYSYVESNPDLDSKEILAKIMHEDSVIKIMEQREDVATIFERIQQLPINSREELIKRSYEVSYMYCYFDNFDEEFEKLLSKKEKNFMEKLQDQTYYSTESNVVLTESNIKEVKEKEERS